MVQIVVTIVVFIVTLTKGAPAFPLLIVALVPVRLLLMNKIWPRETLRFVDAWACRRGTPEDDEDAKITATEDGFGVAQGLEQGEVDILEELAT